jgi:tryptophan-rich sensory protein
VLYVLIGVAGWRVWREPRFLIRRRAAALSLWGWQLLCNALWTPAFFGLQSPLAGLLVLVVLIVMIGATMFAFSRIDRLATWLMAPYAGWVFYATYLNAGFWWLN